MQTPILKTKLYIPPARPGLIPRPRLYNKLGEGLRPGCPLTLVSAPAGFGKTVLLSSWISHVGIPVAWLGLDSADNDPLRFWRHIVAALQTIKAASDESMQIAMEAVQGIPQDLLVTSLINDIAQINGIAILVLEDYHLVENKSIHDGINFLLNHLPPQFHLVITTRSDPPLQIARRRAAMELNEIRAVDLRFTRDEVKSFLNESMKLGLSSEDIEALETRTEGWIVGLQMAALSMQGRGDKHAFITSFTGDDRYIADYLLEEVLQRQPPGLQDFLLRTSALNRLNASLCDAILDPMDLSSGAGVELVGSAEVNKPRLSSQDILEYLEHSNLFIVPLDDRRQWFRYHHLFTRLLNQRLIQTHGPQEIHAIKKKASRWLEANGMLPDSVEYALACADYENATRLIGMVGNEMFARSEINTVLSWAGELPVEMLVKQPTLCALFAWAALATGHSQQSERYLDLIEKSVGATTDAFLADTAGFAALQPLTRSALYEAGVIRARLALDQFDTKRTYDLARLVLPYLLEQNKQPFIFNEPYQLRAPLLQTMALAYKIDGDLETASCYFSEAIDLAREQNNIHIYAISMSEIGQILILQGRLVEAAAIFQKALYAPEIHVERMSVFSSMSFVGLGTLAYELNDLEKAERLLREGLKLARIWNYWEALIPGYLGLAQLLVVQGNLDEADKALGELKEVLTGATPILLTPVKAYQAWLAVLQGNLKFAQAWVESAGFGTKGDLDERLEAEAIIAARIYHTLGKTEQALELLARLLELVEKRESWGRAIQILALQALFQEASNLQDEAIETMRQALSLAAPQGYLRTFIDAGKPMAKLLTLYYEINKTAGDKSNLSSYLSRLLAAFDEEKTGLRHKTTGQAIETRPGLFMPPVSTEPLSRREQDVLRLMADGATNSEIARQLFLSVNTVKKHVANIFDKLDATTRVQAVKKGRRAGYLQ